MKHDHEERTTRAARIKETYVTPTLEKHEKLVDITMVTLSTVTVTG